MLRLTFVLYSFAGTLLAGIGIIISLMWGQGSIQDISTAALAGATLGFPLAMILAWKIVQD